MLFLMLSICVPLLLPGSSMPQVWTNLGLYGGYIYDIAVDSTNPNKIFAGSYMGDGLFLTSDGGDNWQPVKMEHRYEGEDTFKNQAVFAVRIAQGDSNVVWAGHNYWVAKSTDGGKNWAHIRNSSMQRDCAGCGGSGDNFRFCKSLAIDPNNSLRLFVGTGGPAGTSSLGAVYRTEDGGSSWTKTNFGANLDYEVTSIAIDPKNSMTIWAATDSKGVGGVYAGSLYRSGDGGETWNKVMGLNSGFTSVAVKPDNSDIVFTGSGWGIIKVYFDGTAWQYQWPVIPETVGCRLVQDIVFDPQEPDVIYAAWRNSWFGDLLPKVSRSVDGGINWETYVVEPQFSTLAVSPTNGEIVYGGDTALGVFQSGDHGQTWMPINNGINAIIVYDVQTDPKDSTHILVGTISGVYEKKQGKDWSRILTYGAKSVEFHPQDSQRVFAGLEQYLAKTTDGGLQWSYSKVSNETRFINDISINPIDPEILYLAVDSYGGGGAIFKTENGGGSFSRILIGQNSEGQVYDFNTVTIDPSDTHHILSGGGNFYAPRVTGDLWESKDAGITWSRNSLGDLKVIVNALLIDPNNPEAIYAGCGYSAETDVPIYKSTDGGGTWRSSFAGIPGKREILHGIWGETGNDVLTVGWGGTILHYDGSNWTPMISGTTKDLEDVWGSSPTSVFAVGSGGTILYYDGNIWTSIVSGTTEVLYGVWGSSPMSVFAVGSGGTILYYDGNIWTPIVSGTTEVLYGVWGSSSASAFAVGEKGTILYYDGNAWTPMISGTTAALWGVWGISPGSVFAVGENGTILHFDKDHWTSMASGTDLGLNTVWGTSSGDVYSAGEMATVLHFNGKEWLNSASFGTREAFMGVWGSSSENVFFVGEFGAIQRYDSVQWTSLREPGAKYNSVTDLKFHRLNTDVVYASTLGAGVYISPNQARNWLNLAAPDYDVRALSTGSLYAATQGGLHQCTGTGVIAGELRDRINGGVVNGATVFSDLGVKSLSVNGAYMMVNPVGEFSVTAVKDGYANQTMGKVTVYGGDVSWADFSLDAGVADPTVVPSGSAAGDIGGGGCFISTLFD